MTDDITVERHGDRTRLCVTGDLDLGVRDVFMARVTELADAGARMTLDLRRVTSIDSTGLSCVIQADRLARSAGCPSVKVLIGDNGPVRRMFELTLLHLTLDVSTG